MKHIIISGPRGVGKTTLINRLLQTADLTPSGFFTRKEYIPPTDITPAEFPSYNGPDELPPGMAFPFHAGEKPAASPAAALSKEPANGFPPGLEYIYIHPAAVPVSERRYEERNRVGSCGTARMHDKKPEVFDTLGVRYLHDCPLGTVVIMDELGFFETDALRFRQAVLDRLDGEIPVLAAVKFNNLPFLNAVRQHPNSMVFPIDESNRDELFETLLPLVRSWKK